MTALPNASASQAQSPLSHYLKHLNAFENKEFPSVEETIAVMLARDAVEQWMSPQMGAEAVSKVVHLDERLRSQAIKMHHLPTCRDTTNPPADKWWWWLSTITIENAEMVADNAEDKAEADAAGVPGWARWDWLWNLGNVSCLVLSAGLMSQPATAYSKEGFDLFGTISTIGQGAGLAIVASGAITEDGKKKVQNILKGFNIPEQYHSEVTFAGSTVMLAASAGLLFNLPTVGNVYYNLGQRQERQGIWDKALESYQRAARFSPQNSDIVLAEGRLHETLGNFPAAIAAYEPEANLGKPEFNNALARTLLTQGFQTKNWELPLRKRTLSAISLRLDRTERALPENVLENNNLDEFLLKADLSVNQLIYDFSKRNWNDFTPSIEVEADGAVVFSTETYTVLDKVASLGVAETQSQRLLSEGISLNTTNLDRANCYHHTLIDALHSFLIERPWFEDEVATAYFYGPPGTHRRNQVYACALITGRESKPENLNDGKILEVLGQDISAAGRKVYENNRTDFINRGTLSWVSNSVVSRYSDIEMISAPKTWQTVSQKVKEQIAETLEAPFYEVPPAENTVIFRVFATDQGNIIDAWAYDVNSQATLEPFANAWQAKAQAQLAALFPEPPTESRHFEMTTRSTSIATNHAFVDLKVVIDQNQQEVEILDWQASYPTSFSEFQQPLPENEITVQSGNPKDSMAEKSILAQLLADTMSDIIYGGEWIEDTIFTSPIEYTVTMALDGQVIAIEPMDNIADKAMSDDLLKAIQKSMPTEINHALPTAKVKLSFKSADIFKVVPL